MPLSLRRRPQSAYDAEGRRVGKGVAANLTCSAPPANGFTLTNQYLLGRTGEQVTELNGAAALLHSNAYLGSRLLATYDFVNGGLHFALTDPLGTKRVQVSGQGVPELNCLSLPFGNDLGNPRATDCVPAPNATALAADAAEPHFTGKERDSESGNDYFEARYYASSMGRFLSPDWSAKEEPVPYAKLDNPQSLNLYSYVLNNPLTSFDNDGHEIIYADGLKNSQLVRDSVTAILANPNTSSYLSGYVGPNAPNLTIQSGDLGPPTVTTLPNGQTLTTTVQGNTAPDIQTSTMTDNNGVKTSETTLTGATITIDNNTSKGDTPGVMIHESVHAGEAQANPAKFSADAKAERGQPHDSRPQEQRANGVRAANEKQIKQQIKQIEKDRKKDQQ
jgi:RHS repeat-associated protein